MDSLSRKLLVASIFSLMILLNGCGKQILSANQINPIIKNEIHVMTVTATNSNTKEITDQTLINSIIKNLNNIQFKEIGKNDESKVLDKGNKLTLNSTFTVELMKEKHGKAESNLIAISEKELLLANSSTLQSNDRTVLYINENDQTSLEAVKEIYSLLKSTNLFFQPMDDYTEAVREYVTKTNYKVAVNSGAGLLIKLPNSFDEKFNDFNIGEFLHKKNEQSKQNGLDFKEYLGKEVMLFTYASAVQEGNLVLLIYQGKVVGAWIDDTEENLDDFHVIRTNTQDF
jgi:hypothetical protein